MKNGKRVGSGEALPSRVTARVVRASGLSLLFLALLLLGHSFPPCHLYHLWGFKSSEASINRSFYEFYKKDGMREAKRNRFSRANASEGRANRRLRCGRDREFLRWAPVSTSRRHAHRKKGARGGDPRARPPDHR